MASETERLDASNEGSGNVETGVTANLPQSYVEYGNGGEFSVENLKAVAGDQVQEPAGTAEAQPTEPYDHLPPELRPVDGKFPQLNEALMRKLRGKYFTVTHPRLQACGHKMDLMNEPRTNCEDCWFAWFNTHQKLVEVADEMYRSKGKEALIGMRGKRFFKMFVRFMVTVIQLAKEQEQRGIDSGSTQSGTEGNEGSVHEAVLTGGQAEGSGVGSEVTE